ncbi:hypothetical protein ACTXOR_00725 [Arthrobacter rhombi]|uniref:hypothetical protein n=1 Tax=Arthrobacter rhombi TaxID=71253 RepID=UPI003FCF54BE
MEPTYSRQLDPGHETARSNHDGKYMRCTALRPVRMAAAFLAATLLLAGCSAPAPSGSVTAAWDLRTPQKVTPDSTSLDVDVYRLECSGGTTGTVERPHVAYEPERILVHGLLSDLPDGNSTCLGVSPAPTTINLSEPVGHRAIVDASCLEEDNTDLTGCEDQGIRWRPSSPG